MAMLSYAIVAREFYRCLRQRHRHHAYRDVMPRAGAIIRRRYDVDIIAMVCYYIYWPSFTRRSASRRRCCYYQKESGVAITHHETNVGPSHWFGGWRMVDMNMGATYYIINDGAISLNGISDTRHCCRRYC